MSPVHTFYGPADLFRADSARRMGDEALRALDVHAPHSDSFAEVVGWKGQDAERLYSRVRDKLAREPIEDFRLDFEDGYGIRPDDEEDATAKSAAAEVAKGMETGTLPGGIGIRIKQFTTGFRRRARRTLSLFLSTLLERTSGKLPRNFVITLPKVMTPAQAGSLTNVLAQAERRHKLAKGVLKLELMVEAPQSLIGPDGRSPLPAMIRAARGRCVGVPFGVYDYTASLGITPAEQRMRHPACDAARQLMQIGLAGTGVALSDGGTNVLPVGERPAVVRAWKLHYDDVRHSLSNAYYQGWDLHPAQLCTRYAAVFAFFHESLEAAARRLRVMVEKASQAALVGNVADDAATGQALLNFFARGFNCGALGDAEIAATGLTVDELRGGSFLKILESRTPTDTR